MPCLHKFHEYLNLELIDFEPATLIVGTFNPVWPAENQANWFYGRTTTNNFWNVLPRMYNVPSLVNSSEKDWKLFCKGNLVAITDLLFSINDAEENNPNHQKVLRTFRDSEIAKTFKSFTQTPIVEILEKQSSIKSVYLTRTSDAFWGTWWLPVKKYCDQNAIHCECLYTPSKSGYENYLKYLDTRYEPNMTYRDYIIMRWNKVWKK